MIALSTPTFDPAGTLILARPGPGSELISAARRVTRTATLDGGVAIADTGYSPGDRTVRLTIPKASPAQIETVSRLVRLYPLITVCLRDGAYSAVPSNYDLRNGGITLILLLTAQLSE